nr:hypothetical protein [Ferranicluibacter rubi]
MSWFPISAGNRQDLHIPIAWIAFDGDSRSRKPRGNTLPCRRYGGLRNIIPLPGPEIWPRATLDPAEIVHPHDLLPAIAHKLEISVQIEDLDAVSGA